MVMGVGGSEQRRSHRVQLPFTREKARGWSWTPDRELDGEDQLAKAVAAGRKPVQQASREEQESNFAFPFSYLHLLPHLPPDG